MDDYEEDHLVPLDLGGAPDDARNLWPEPKTTADGWNADVKDELETVLARLVCSGRIPLAQAQQAIATGSRPTLVTLLTKNGESILRDKHR